MYFLSPDDEEPIDMSWSIDFKMPSSIRVRKNCIDFRRGNEIEWLLISLKYAYNYKLKLILGNEKKIFPKSNNNIEILLNN